uniref:Uncharacterized protein n=1 Tax=Tetradesmus obliquus TaxID=3088 RepID=A0A383V538_TETOB|eukprot:jgi/Sobl393_1/7728/SZX59496.1
MGQGSSKHYYDLLVAPEWSKGVESLSLVSDVCDLAEQLAADRCGKHAIKVYQKCCELRGVRDAWAGMHQAAAQLHGQQVYQVAQDMQTLNLKLTWCKARLLRGSKSAALTKTAQQHAAKLEGILAVAYEAHTNFQTSFTLAVAASTQQLQAGAGQQPLETPYSSHSRTAVLQQRSAAPGSCPGRLQQASCSNPGVELAPRFFTSCGEPTACQQQQLAALQAPLQQALQLSQSIAQAADGEQQIKRNVEAQDASTLVANLEAAAGIPQQIVQQDSSEDLVAAALACMPDYQRAWALLQQAAGASGEACHLLGQLCEQGLGLPAADYEQAAAWYGHGAALQHAASAHALAFALENGLGVTRDLAAALDWYVFAAESGHAPAQNNMGRLLIAGEYGVPADTASALQWLQAAAEQGSAAAWFNMGTCFEWGVGECAVDVESAQECYVHAAELGHHVAVARLRQLQQDSSAQGPASPLSAPSGHHPREKHSLGSAGSASTAGGRLFLQQQVAAVKAMHQVVADLQLCHA